jgi:prepilin-type N-terminal cleavage/methylation domain-containing protein/prepilin-type processing-associated H-X9-DG protein
MRKDTMRKNRRTARGFTLVELLVVIGIIALLISILLPTLNGARQAAVTVQCSSNMRQAAMGMLAYIEAHKGRIPPNRSFYNPGSSGGFNNDCWPEGFYWSNALAFYGYVKSPSSKVDGQKWVNDWGRRGTIFMCPTTEDGDPASFPAVQHARSAGHFQASSYPTRFPGSPLWFAVLTSYSLPNTYWGTTVGLSWDNNHPGPNTGRPAGMGAYTSSSDYWTSPENQRTMSKIRRTSNMVLLVESTQINLDWWNPGGYLEPYPRLLAGRHGRPTNNGRDGLTNLAFFDGHVETVSTELISRLDPAGGRGLEQLRGQMVFRLSDQ